LIALSIGWPFGQKVYQQWPRPIRDCQRGLLSLVRVRAGR
jgi:hypothetical protein